MTRAALPTHKDEAWRYSDLAALQRAWPLPEPESIMLAAGETAHRALLVNGADDRAAVREHRVMLGAGARFSVHVLDLGGSLGRVSFDVTLAQGAHFELKGALIGGEGETVELVTSVHHVGPDATSAQTVRAIAGARAVTSYLGQVRVARGAQKTDAAQSFKAMLLDRTASANAKPELEIFADDVKCAHGATVGELDKAALYYMASRGLDPAAAQALLLRAFIAGLFDDMPDESEHERFQTAAIAKLEALT